MAEGKEDALFHRSVAVVAAFALAAAARAQEPPASKPPEAPGHHHAGVNERHDHVTGVSHATSVHHFTLFADGGRIQLEARDAADVATRDLIRTHLQQVVTDFSSGRFEMPHRIHGTLPPGVDVLREKKAVIHYRYEPTGRGGRVEITTGDGSAREAIHAFLRFQIDDHATGDPKQVAARR
jgi:hypothetical protein